VTPRALPYDASRDLVESPDRWLRYVLQRRAIERHGRTPRSNLRRSTVETMIGIAALLVGLGVLWLCFALGVYFFTRTGREGMRIERMEEERRHQAAGDP
jgi:hypothetical protein